MTAHAGLIPCLQATAAGEVMLSFSWRTRLAIASAVAVAAAAARREGAAGTGEGERWLRPPGLQKLSPRCLAAVSAALGQLRRGSLPTGAGREGPAWPSSAGEPEQCRPPRLAFILYRHHHPHRG